MNSVISATAGTGAADRSRAPVARVSPYTTKTPHITVANGDVALVAPLHRQMSVCAAICAAASVVAVTSVTGCADEPPRDCAAELADLDGDGAVDGNDCLLAATGLATRAFCEGSPYLWISSSACSSTSQESIETSTAGPDILEMTGQGSPVFFELSSNGVRPFAHNGPEDQWVNAAVSGAFGTRLLDATYPMAATDTHVWFDWNHDSSVSADEVTALDEAFQAQTQLPLQNAIVALDPEGRPTLVASLGGSGGALGFVVWKDRNRDRHATSQEITLIPGAFPISSDGREVCYRDFIGDQGHCWTDLNDDAVVQPTETSSSPYPAACSRIYFFRYCRTFSNGLLELNYADAHDIGSSQWVILASSDVLRVHIGGVGTAPILWTDSNRDRRVGDGEELTMPIDALVGDVASITTSGALASRIDAFRGADARLFAVESRWAGGGTYETFTVTRQPAAVYLGEPCSTATPCADNLRCERSGNAQAARCALSLP